VKTVIARIAIVLVLLVEIAWIVLPKTGDTMHTAYRHDERIEALKQYAENPSASNWQNVQNEMNLLNHHASTQMMVMCVVLLIIDGILVACFWNLQLKKRKNISRLAGSRGNEIVLPH